MPEMSQTEENQKPAGYPVTKPSKIPLRGWIQIMKRVWQQLKSDNVQIVSAGVAFYFFLSLFPAIAAFLLLYGLIMSPAEAAGQVEQLRLLLPSGAYQVIWKLANKLAEDSSSSLGWGGVGSIGLSIFSANKGTNALFTGLNIAYNQKDRRPFIRRSLLTLCVTVGTIVIGSLLLALVAVIPAITQALPLPEMTEMVLKLLRLPVIVILGLAILGFLYKVAPYRSNPHWRWVTPGSIVAILLWLLGSLGFGWYIDSFGNMSKTYGSIAAIVVLMLWFFITAYAILLGAEINNEYEQQTDHDAATTPDQDLNDLDTNQPG